MALRKRSEDTVNVCQRYARVVDEYGTQSWAKFQMCMGLKKDKIFGSVEGSGVKTCGAFLKSVDRK